MKEKTVEQIANQRQSGKTYLHQIGNSVCPKIAESLVGAGLAK